METNFKIEKGIPVPNRKSNTSFVWPFNIMEVEDSVFISLDSYSRSKHSMVANAARNMGKRKTPIWKYTTRRVIGGVRVWRVE